MHGEGTPAGTSSPAVSAVPGVGADRTSCHGRVWDTWTFLMDLLDGHTVPGVALALLWDKTAHVAPSHPASHAEQNQSQRSRPRQHPFPDLLAPEPNLMSPSILLAPACCGKHTVKSDLPTRHTITLPAAPRGANSTRGPGAQPGEQQGGGHAGCNDSYPGNDSAFRNCKRESRVTSCLPAACSCP